ncbi:monofunctional biosynthetic peptidoglycan transglycosylase [Bradyrhizobium sp. GM22.5]
MRVVKTLLLVLAVAALAPYVVAPFYRAGHPVSTLMIWRSLRGAPMQREWIDLAAMSPSLPRSVVAAEDAHFCKHHGIDWGALREAIDDAKEDGTPFRGASTITQQVAKNLFLWQGRDFVRKALEFPLALWIDLVLPKARILEIYLNIAELGPQSQFGAEAASAYAFGKSAANLSPRGGRASSLYPAESGQTQRQDAGTGCPAAGRDLCGASAGEFTFDLLAGESLISGPFRAHFPAQSPRFKAGLPL